MTSKQPAPSWIRSARTRDEVDLLAFVPLAQKFGHRYARFLGSFDDAFQEAMIGLIEALDHWDPSRGPFEKIVIWYVQSHFNGLIQKDETRRSVPPHLRRKARYASWRGRSYALRPWEEVEIKVVSDSQVGEHGDDLSIFDTVASDDLDPEQRMIAEEEARLRRGKVAEVAAGLCRDDREFVRRAMCDTVPRSARRSQPDDAPARLQTEAYVRGILRKDEHRRARLRHAFRALRP